jgi:hypothetical protein
MAPPPVPNVRRGPLWQVAQASELLPSDPSGWKRNRGAGGVPASPSRFAAAYRSARGKRHHARNCRGLVREGEAGSVDGYHRPRREPYPRVPAPAEAAGVEPVSGFRSGVAEVAAWQRAPMGCARRAPAPSRSPRRDSAGKRFRPRGVLRGGNENGPPIRMDRRAVSRCVAGAEAEGLEPPCGCPRRISSAVPYQLGLRLPYFCFPISQSGRADLNRRPLAPEASALPG